MEPESDEAPLDLYERLDIFCTRLRDAPPATNGEEAFKLVVVTLTAVEDEHSGVAALPNPPLKYMGRMYPPQEDHTTSNDQGAITARTAGHRIHCSAEGDITITSLKTGEVLISKRGRTQ